MNLRFLVILLSTMMFSTTGQAASIYAGKAKAAAVCAQCHGIRSTSAKAPFPPLKDPD